MLEIVILPIFLGIPVMDETRLRYLYTTVVLFITASGLIDLYADGLGSPWGMHQTIEVVLLCVGVISVIWLWALFARQMRRARESLEVISGELEHFRSRHIDTLKAMRNAVNDQFQRWNFSPTESKVAELLIRGYTMRQIAAMLEKSERTVRNQAISLYQKSSMSGRNDLTAFFLQEVMGEEES